MIDTVDFQYTFTAADRSTMERKLEEAHAVATERAMAEGTRGVLVTRHSYDRFTVALSDAVPFGLTHEQQAW